MKTCTKVWSDIPFAHRAPHHDGHCKLLHGHNWSFAVTFGALKTDQNGFVVDFGKLKDLKESLDDIFDHSLVLSTNDPMRPAIEEFVRDHGIYNVQTIPDCSCEGIAKFVYDLCDSFVIDNTKGRAYVVEVTVHEDARNSATYRTANVPSGE